LKSILEERAARLLSSLRFGDRDRRLDCVQAEEWPGSSDTCRGGSSADTDEGTQMPMKGMIAALALGLAAPAFAQSDVAKNVGDKAKDASDTVQDKLHTDSGTHKMKRHLDRSARHAKGKARSAKRQVKSDANKTKDDVKDATK
jgi:hypothetical protein